MLTLEDSSPAPVVPDNGRAEHVIGHANHSPDRGVQPGTVAAASKHSYTHARPCRWSLFMAKGARLRDKAKEDSEDVASRRVSDIERAGVSIDSFNAQYVGCERSVGRASNYGDDLTAAQPPLA